MIFVTHASVSPGQFLGLHGVPHKGGKYVPQDSNVVVGSSWGATTPASPPKVGFLLFRATLVKCGCDNYLYLVVKNYSSENERGQIEYDLTVPAKAHQTGKRHFGEDVQQDHISTKDG